MGEPRPLARAPPASTGRHGRGVAPLGPWEPTLALPLPLPCPPCQACVSCAKMKMPLGKVSRKCRSLQNPDPFLIHSFIHSTHRSIGAPPGPPSARMSHGANRFRLPPLPRSAPSCVPIPTHRRAFAWAVLSPGEIPALMELTFKAGRQILRKIQP